MQNNAAAIESNDVVIIRKALDAPCPFCGGKNLMQNFWSLNGAEVDAVECNDCCAGAPARAWIRRK